MIFKRYRDFFRKQAQKVRDYSVIINGVELTLIVFILIIPMLCLPLLGFMSVQDQIKTLKVQIEVLKEEQAAMNNDQRRLTEAQGRLTDAMMSWLEVWQVDMFEASAYAPLDDQNGMNSWRDGEYMTSGVRTRNHIDTAISVDNSVIPQGAQVWIKGIGWRVAHDTGSAIVGKKIDIPMWRFHDAISFGRRDVIVVWPRQPQQL